MSSYTPERYGLPRGLDEVGLKLSLFRLPGENQNTYRRRLLLQVRQTPSTSLEGMVKSVNRTVGQFEKRVIKIELVLNPDGSPIVPDPCIVVAATRLLVYSDFANLTLAKTINIWDRDGSYFLRDVLTELSAVAFLTVSTEDDYSPYLLSKNLRIGTSEQYQYSEFLNTAACNVLDKQLIKGISFNNYNIFSSLKTSKALMTEPGDYYVDMVNGIVFSYSTQAGQAFYSYRDFPFYLWWQPVRIEQANDPTLRYATRNTLIENTTGQPSHLLLNEYGAKIAQEIISIHPMKWGE